MWILNLSEGSNSNLRKLWAFGGNLLVTVRLTALTSENSWTIILSAKNYQRLKGKSEEASLHILSSFYTASCCSLMAQPIWYFKLVWSVATKKYTWKVSFALWSDDYCPGCCSPNSKTNPLPLICCLSCSIKLVLYMMLPNFF